MNPIALVTCYYHHNYGSMLQAYATQMIMDELKLPYETLACKASINYMEQNKLIYYVKKLLIADWNMKIGKIKINYYKRKYKKSFGNGVNLRDTYFDNFAKEHFNVSPYYQTRDELSTAAVNYSAFLVGSDQLWRTDSIEHGYYTLEFVPDTILKIAYSTSFGITRVPWFQIKKNKRFLNRFHFIAVREKSGAKLIKELTGKDVPVVLDPTLLFTGEQWLHLQQREPIINRDYIFCYLLGNNPYQRALIKQLKEKTGMKIVALLHLDEYIPSDEAFADESPYNIGPKEFLNLIRSANYVFTDSFHCTVFSILYKKNFFTFNRFNSSSIQSTNTRIDNLLSLTGLENRRIDRGHSVEHCLSLSLNFDGVDDKIACLHNFSIDYLKKAFLSLNK
jgi:hypothetical protein